MQSTPRILAVLLILFFLLLIPALTFYPFFFLPNAMIIKVLPLVHLSLLLLFRFE
jgi:hypothetical protein